MNERYATQLATFGLIGFFPFFPGTVASFVTVAIVWLVSVVVAPVSGWGLLGAAIGLFFIGIPAATAMEKILGHQDPRPVVIDEVVGQMVALAFLPLTWPNMLMAFLLFRFFDIVKPYPICWIDKHVPAGLGIMSDDLLAGIFSLGLGHLILTMI